MRHSVVGEAPSFESTLAGLKGYRRLAAEDAAARDRLERQCRRVDPDERPELDPPPECEVCHGPVIRSPRGAKSKASICRTCSDAGWRSRRCSCGNLLHTRDYVSNRKRWRLGLTRPELCGACRRMVLEYVRG